MESLCFAYWVINIHWTWLSQYEIIESSKQLTFHLGDKSMCTENFSEIIQPGGLQLNCLLTTLIKFLRFKILCSLQTFLSKYEDKLKIVIALDIIVKNNIFTMSIDVWHALSPISMSAQVGISESISQAYISESSVPSRWFIWMPTEQP